MSSPKHAYWSPSAPPKPLDAFTGTWTGNGFNTIFRPNRDTTKLPKKPIPSADGVFPASDPDNLLQLNLTFETLFFSDSLTDIPNRPFLEGQLKVSLKGVPYSPLILCCALARGLSLTDAGSAHHQ